MKVLILFDSIYGNAQQIAEAISGTFSNSNEVKLVFAPDAKLEDLENIDLIVVGTPSQQGRPQQSLVDFFDRIPAKGLQNVHFAVFDVRLQDHKLMIGGKVDSAETSLAASQLYSLLWRKGGKSVTDPNTFIALEKEGPLKEGEIERAKAWAKEIIMKV